MTAQDIISDAGIQLGMTYDDAYKILKSKYVNKTYNVKRDTMRFDRYGKGDSTDVTVQFAMTETWPYLMFLSFKKNRLVRYAVFAVCNVPITYAGIYAVRFFLHREVFQESARYTVVAMCVAFVLPYVCDLFNKVFSRVGFHVEKREDA